MIPAAQHSARDDTGPAISISVRELLREASEFIILAQAIRDRAQPGPNQDIPAALIARDRLRALIGTSGDAS